MCIVAWNAWLRQSQRRRPVVRAWLAFPGRPVERPAARSEGPRFEGGSRELADPAGWASDMVRLRPPAAAVLVARGGVRELENSMTFHLEWLKTGRALRGTPRRRGPGRRLVALSLIAGLAMIQAGCQSGPFGNCGSCNSCGFVRRVTSRVFNRGAGCCGSGVVGGGPAAVEYGTPSTVVGSPTTSVPFYGPPASGSIPSTVPVSPDNPTNLDAVPKTRIVPLPSGSNSTSGSGARPTGYYTGQSSSTKTAVRLDSGRMIEATTGAGSASSANGENSRDDDNPLDHLPPLGLPGEVTQSEHLSPAPSASEPEGKPGDPSSSETSESSEGSPSQDSVSLALPADAWTENDGTTDGGTGIARFASVDLELAGGSLPSSSGLSWLAERGYRTVLDLRESSEVSPAFIADAASRGLRYVALPVSLKTLDPDRLARFQFELAATEARPLFFFDSDGSRAGALWYIRRVSVDHVDAQLARREAEDIGLKDPVAWEAATAYVRRLDDAKAHPTPARSAASDPPAASAATPAAADRADSPDSFTAGTTKTSSAGPQSPSLDDYPSHEPMNWQPFAAMLLTGLSLPLAYWTRTAIPDAIARARASLPAPAPRPRSLPHASDE